MAALDVPSPPVLAGIPPSLFAPPAQMQSPGLAGVFDGIYGDGEFLSPRVAAVAVIALLGFGVLIGSLLGPLGVGQRIYLLANSTPAAGTATDAAVAAPTDSQVPVAQLAAQAPVQQIAPVNAPAGSVAIKHLWLIVLSGQGYDKTFGDANSSSYLVSSLAPQGAVIPNYYAVAQGELANNIALVSGQGPTWQIARNCPDYTAISPGNFDSVTQQVLGDGCVFPNNVQTIGDAIGGTGKTWGAYVQGIDNGANGRSSVCRTPTSGAPDPDHRTDANNAYASWSNPFVYFQSVTTGANCPYAIFGLSSLYADLQNDKSAAFSMIVPDRCHSGSDKPCAPGAPAGIASSDAFLSEVVPRITASRDYQDGGVIAITFDHSPQGAVNSDTSSCCGQPAYPNLVGEPPFNDATGATGATGGTGETGPTGSTDQAGAAVGPEPQPQSAFTYVKTNADGSNAGGGKVGLLLISPYVKPGNTDVTESYNHYSLLLSIENWFGTAKLGYTSQTDISALPDSLFTAPPGSTGATGSTGKKN